MSNYCSDCEVENCELRDQINFCVDCKDYCNCDICYACCAAGHSIECNNGFEVRSYFDDEYDEDEEYDEEFDDSWL